MGRRRRRASLRLELLSKRPADPAVQTRYRKALKISLRWIRNYTDLDFRSLGSYTRPQLDAVAAGADSF